jgi:hypothetical protein
MKAPLCFLKNITFTIFTFNKLFYSDKYFYIFAKNKIFRWRIINILTYFNLKEFDFNAVFKVILNFNNYFYIISLFMNII